MRGHVHDEAVADPARRADSGLAGHYSPHQLVGVQAALHQRFGSAAAHELDGLGRRIVAVGGVDELERPDVQPGAIGNVANARQRPD
jgi:hypothetical protein